MEIKSNQNQVFYLFIVLFIFITMLIGVTLHNHKIITINDNSISFNERNVPVYGWMLKIKDLVNLKVLAEANIESDGTIHPENELLVNFNFENKDCTANFKLEELDLKKLHMSLTANSFNCEDNKEQRIMSNFKKKIYLVYKDGELYVPYHEVRLFSKVAKQQNLPQSFNNIDEITNYMNNLGMFYKLDENLNYYITTYN